VTIFKGQLKGLLWILIAQGLLGCLQGREGPTEPKSKGPQLNHQVLNDLDIKKTLKNSIILSKNVNFERFFKLQVI